MSRRDRRKGARTWAEVAARNVGLRRAALGFQFPLNVVVGEGYYGHRPSMRELVEAGYAGSTATVYRDRSRFQEAFRPYDLETVLASWEQQLPEQMERLREVGRRFRELGEEVDDQAVDQILHDVGFLPA